MENNDTGKVISILYVLTLLFLGVIYLQGDVVSDVASATAATHAVSEFTSAQSASIIENFQMSNGSALIVLVSVSLFFGFAWLMTRSKTY